MKLGNGLYICMSSETHKAGSLDAPRKATQALKVANFAQDSLFPPHGEVKSGREIFRRLA
jgi:hypothetical protein